LSEEEQSSYQSKALAMVPLPKSGAKMAALLAIAIMIGTLCLAFVPWQQTVTANGKVAIFSPMNRPQNIESQINGRIKQWHVKDGQEVSKKQLIVTLDETEHKFLDPNLATSQQKQKASVLKRLNAGRQRARALQDQLAHLLQTKNDPALVHELKVKIATALENVALTEQELQNIDTEISTFERRSGQLQVESAIAGTVVKTYKSAGETVSSGTILAVVAPHTEDLCAELTISGNDAPLVSRGESVRLQFAGFPAVQFGGLPSARSGTFAGKIFAVDPVDDGKGNYRAIVLPDQDRIKSKDEEPWPSSKRIRSGSKVNGWIVLKIVPLGFEIWRRVNAFPQSIDKAEIQPSPKS
jgi:multidrug efflux pump subunit AcrA (membrane-fusion protein)